MAVAIVFVVVVVVVVVVLPSVWGSHCSASCAYAADLTSNVEQIPVFNLSLLNFLYLFECLYVHGHKEVIVSCSLWSRPCIVV